MCPLQDYSAVADSLGLIFPSPMNRAEEGKHFREEPGCPKCVLVFAEFYAADWRHCQPLTNAMFEYQTALSRCHIRAVSTAFTLRPYRR